MANAKAYHWIITVQHPGGFSTADGIIDMTPGMTRQSVYQQLQAQMQQQLGSNNCVVRNFILEPNEL